MALLTVSRSFRSELMCADKLLSAVDTLGFHIYTYCPVQSDAQWERSLIPRR